MQTGEHRCAERKTENRAFDKIVQSNSFRITKREAQNESKNSEFGNIIQEPRKDGKRISDVGKLRKRPWTLVKDEMKLSRERPASAQLEHDVREVRLRLLSTDRGLALLDGESLSCGGAGAGRLSADDEEDDGDDVDDDDDVDGEEDRRRCGR